MRVLYRRTHLRAGLWPELWDRFVRARVHHLLDDHSLHRGAGRIDLLPRLGRLDVEDSRQGAHKRRAARGDAPHLLLAELDLLLWCRDLLGRQLLHGAGWHLAYDDDPRYRLHA